MVVLQKLATERGTRAYVYRGREDVPGASSDHPRIHLSLSWRLLKRISLSTSAPPKTIIRRDLCENKNGLPACLFARDPNRLFRQKRRRL